MAGPEGLSVQNFNGRIDVATENPVRRPRRRPAHRAIPKWKEHESRTRKLAGGRVSCGSANQLSGVRRIAQIPCEGGSVVDGTLPEVAQGR